MEKKKIKNKEDKREYKTLDIKKMIKNIHKDFSFLKVVLGSLWIKNKYKEKMRKNINFMIHEK